MARKRTEYGFDVDSEIRAQLARGGKAPGIAAALQSRGVDVSLATVTRRIRELRAGTTARAPSEQGPAVAASPSAPMPAPARAKALTGALTLPESPEAIPEGADLDGLIVLADEEGRAALKRGDLDGFGKMGRLSVALHEARRKATPLPKADPNDRPDLIKAKELARARFHKLIDEVLT